MDMYDDAYVNAFKKRFENRLTIPRSRSSGLPLLDGTALRAILSQSRYLDGVVVQVMSGSCGSSSLSI